VSFFDKNDDPPQPPNPVITAGAQTASNVSTAIANAFLGAVNQITPLGSLSYSPTSFFSFTDPSTGAGYNIPQFTATQTLGTVPADTQALQELAKNKLALLANSQSGQLNTLLASPINLSDISSNPQNNPQLPNKIFNPEFQGLSRPLQFDLGDAGAITRDYGPADNFSADRARVEAALFGRLNPQLALERQRTEQTLADQGIRTGQSAYLNAMDVYNRQANDARLAVTQTAGQEQQRLNDMAAQRAGFQNAAQQQAYSQLLGRGQFYNAAAQQGEAMQMGRAAFFNAANRQFYLEDPMALRQQALTERYALRNQPINEVTALLSGSQVQQPHFMQTPQTQIPTTDVAGITNQATNQQLQIWQQQQAQQNQILGGLFGAAGNIGRGAFGSGGFFTQSDRDVKENIHRIGTVFVAEERPVQDPGKKKLPVYEYSYKDDPASTRHVGPMAQDVEKINPGAVRTFDGIKHINVPRVMGSILKAA
jgi:Chaperone of endosialidase